MFLIKIVVASVLMALVVLYINPSDSWWQASGVFLKIGALGGLVLSAMIAYLLAILAMGIRPKQLLRL